MRSGRIAGVRAVVSRVRSASVTVGDSVVGEIGAGVLALVGVARTDVEDGAARARELARKMHGLRIFPGTDGERCAADLGLPFLVVSQFTLYGDTRKGRRPSWSAAAPGPDAEPLVDAVVAELRARGAVVTTGVFGASMQVASVNDGPFTVLVEI